MSGHGGGFSIARARGVSTGVGVGAAGFASIHEGGLASILAVPPHGPQGPIKIAGFRHFLCDSDNLPPDKQFKVDGKDPLRSEASIERLRFLMNQLAKRMHYAPVWEGNEGNPGNPENEDVPAGYTYLLQLVAHDLVQTTFPLSILEDTTTGVRNDRTYRLKLDTIYGAGPEVCPFAYVGSPDPKNGARSRLRTGGGGVNDEDHTEMKPKGRDIGRFEGEKDANSNSPGLTEVLVADPRNDAHAILSQLTALFHHLHNGLMSRLRLPKEKDTADSEIEATFDAFLCARGAATLIYRNIIRHDLMKRVLNPEVYRLYNVARPDFLSEQSVELREGRSETGPTPRSPHRGSLVPLEFTHGAFRFGHAMARDRYVINPGHEFPLAAAIRATSHWRPHEMPLRRKWIISWSHFFDIPKSPQRPQPSVRIGPHFSGQLRDNGLFPPIDRVGKFGLMYRDLMSAGFMRLWSVNSLIEEIRSRRRELIESSELLNKPCYRAQRIRNWLEQKPGQLTEADIHTLSHEPPLPFFILFEAAMGPKDPKQRGKTLGVLGSIIVAEVIFGAMLEDELPAAHASTSLKKALSQLSTSIYTKDRLEFVPEIATMGELVEFVADIAHLTKACPTFL